jgi:hypothetical protein
MGLEFNCRNQAIAQVCAVCSPHQSSLARFEDIAPTKRPLTLGSLA